MIIPKDANKRLEFVRELVNKCRVSVDDRLGDYTSLRSWYLFGAGPEESPAQYNKIFPHIDQLVSFLYSADTTRFSISLGASAHKTEYRYIPPLTQIINDEWTNSGASQVFANAVTWAMVYNSTFIKLVVRGREIVPYLVEPGSIGVLREDIPHTDRQEALIHRYYITKSDLYARLYAHPKREQIVASITKSPHEEVYVPSGVDRIILSQSEPTVMGTVNLDLYGFNRMVPKKDVDVIEMTDLYVYDDEANDYRIITMAEPEVVIYDRLHEAMFLKGHLPFIQVCPNPMPTYYWGQSEVSRLVLLQQMRNKRMTEVLGLLERQVRPPTLVSGFTGLIDERDFALNRAGGVMSSDMPQTKAERLAPDIPESLYEQFREIDAMFEEASGISSVLSGRGEQGVRSAGHASQLARLGSSRAKRRALVIEDSLQKMATMYLKLIQAYDPSHYDDTDGQKFTPQQFTKDFEVKVDAHSNSPIFMEDQRALAFNLFKAKAIDRESLLDLLEPPMKQMLKERLRKLEAHEARQAAAAAPPAKAAKGAKANA